MKTNAPDESMLHAYADDQLAQVECERVEQWLHEHPDAAADVADWANQGEALHAAFDPVMDEPLPDALLDTIRQANDSPVSNWRMAAAIGWLVIGLFGGYLAGHHASESNTFALPELVTDAAVAYAVYTPEVRHPVEVGADQREHLLAWLSKRVGASISAPDLDAHGYSLVGGRLIAGHDGAGALLMYEDASGERLTLFVCHETEEAGTAFRFARHDGVNVFYWVDGQQGYALSGKLPREALQSVATAVYQALNP